MSKHLAAWAWRAPVETTIQRALLVLLAETWTDEGLGNYVPVDELAREAVCSPRSVRRHLRALEDLGLITESDLPAKDSGAGAYQTVAWGINPQVRPLADSLSANSEPADRESASEAIDNGSEGPPTLHSTLDLDFPAFTPGLPDQSQSQSQTLSVISDDSVTDSHRDFDRFWDTYPRKAAKPAARKAWKAVLKRKVEVSVIMEGLARFRFDPDPSFVPYPATWLNQERWADAPDKATAAQEDPAMTDYWKAGGEFL